MSNEDHSKAPLGGGAEEAGQWAIKAMALVAVADGHVDATEINDAKALISSTEMIRESVGPEFGEQLFRDTVSRLLAARDVEIVTVKEELVDLANRIETQELRDQAFQTLLRIASANDEITDTEHEMMTELRQIIGTSQLVPFPSRDC